ncbi:MAG: hypothetical protein FJ253_12250, partial [Phycisphaerae bacterium]|nr:hypothetical protein [Phycisphaerae bacterium]
MTHHRWAELLGRDQLTRRFYRELEGAVHRLAASRTGRAPDVARQELALLTTSRLLFIAFLEAKGWLNGDREFLRHHYDGLCAHGGRVHRRLLDPLFFGTLNTPTAKRSARALAFGHVPFLNGGLFARTASEHRWRDGEFSDDALGGVIATLLGRYRVTAREQSSGLAEAAVDPEMLGRSFESLMASDDRRKSGAFYTPLPILERVTAEAIDEWLATRGVPPDVRLSVRANEPLAPAWRATILEAVGTLRLIDPACGSGAFLVHALERIADLRGKAGDRRSVSERRREVLTRSIFGVDINPTATWLCELRLWLSVVIDEPQRDGATVPPLPNLDHNIRVGDALAGAAFETTVAPEGAARLTVLRARYARSSGVRKRTLARELDRAERRCALADTAGSLASVQSRRREALLVFRGRNLFGERAGPASAGRERDVQADLVMLRGEARALRARLRAIRDGAALPFSFRTHFADVGAAGGFDIVLGNPPWVRIHRLPPAMREEFARRYAAWRNAPWTVGADATGAGRGFAAQVDLAALFVERSTQLTRDNGVISLLVPAKLWTSLSAGGVRDVVQRRCRLVALEDWSESPASFDAVVYPS